MKRMKQCSLLALLLLIAWLFTACQSEPEPVEIVETPDVDATVAAGISATQTAEDSLQATLDAAVAATIEAQPTEVVIEEISTEELSEEALASEINQISDEANASVEEIADYTEQFASDGEMTSEEAAELEYLITEAYDDIEYLLWLFAEYSYYYDDLAQETLDLLVLMEDDLAELLALAVEYSDEFYEIVEMLETGEEVTEEVLQQLEESAGEWEELIGQVSENSGIWYEVLLDELPQRVESWMMMEPQEIAATRVGALAQARSYAKELRGALEDGSVSYDEMVNISQLAANAINSLESVGGTQLQEFAGTITNLTSMAAMGELPAVYQGLSEFEALIPD